MAPPDAGIHRRLAAVCFADIVGYTSLSTRDEAAAVGIVRAFQGSVRDAAEAEGGRLIKFIGDATLTEFPTPEAAVRFALRLRAHFSGASPDRPSLRVGIHVGAIVTAEDGDVYGDGVNIASRLQSSARPGQILISTEVWRVLLPLAAFSFNDLGTRALKGLSHPVGVFEVRGAHDLPRTPVERVGGVLRNQKGLVAAGVALLLAAGGFAYLRGDSGLGERIGGFGFRIAEAGALDPNRIAVLYFDDRSPGQDLGYLADGLTEGLIQQLSEVQALEVVSRNGVKPFRAAAVPFDSIVSALKVGSIVEGSVASAGNRIRVSVQLTSAATQSPIETVVVEADSSNLFALQDTLVREVSHALRRGLGREIEVRRVRRGTDSQAAFEALLQARALREDFLDVREQEIGAARRLLGQADQAAAEAARRDPEWIEPLLLKGWLARDRLYLDGLLASSLDRQWVDSIAQNAARALAMEPGSAEALELVGVADFIRGRLPGANRSELLKSAEDNLRAAVQARPDLAFAWWTLSRIQVDRGDFEEGAISARRALEADAYLEQAARVLHQAYYASLQLGPTEAAVQACEEGRRRFPSNTDFIVCQLFLLASFPQVTPDVELARRLAEELPRTVPQTSRQTFEAFGQMFVAQTAARAGFPDLANRLIDGLQEDGLTPAWLAYNEAHARLLMGQPDQSLELLSRYLSERPDTAMVRRDWWFESLRDDARFRAITGQSR